jgi:hypothetical protein
MPHGVYSADGHMDLFYLPRNLFTSRVPAYWREQVPTVYEIDGVPTWMIGSRQLGLWRGVHGERSFRHHTMEAYA